MFNPLSKQSSFRADIEGLRALAIVLVIGAHFKLPGLSAGFIGVDIFFVISGFLITSILVKEYQNTHQINFMQFYANRFRRLFPALALVVIISCILAYQILSPVEQLSQAKSGIAALFWLSNIFFTYSDASYFGTENAQNLFLHTWSLGVEEQFYLIWPTLLFLAFTFRIFNSSTRSAVVIILGVLILSFIGCLWLSTTNAVFSFYMMPTRAWQFAAGALTWFYLNNHLSSSIWNKFLGFIAFIILLCCFIFITPLTPYPSYWAVLPTLSTCLLLYIGTSKKTLAYQMLSLKPLQYIGALSYSWYLWHWPVLILGAYYFPIEDNYYNAFLLILISLIFSIVSHHFIENPIRFGRVKKIPLKWQIISTLALMVLLSTQILKWHNQTSELLEQNSLGQIQAAANDIAIIYQHGCDEWFYTDRLKPCTYGNPDAAHHAVLLGDSIGAQWFSALTEIYNPADWKITVLTKSACPIMAVTIFYKRIGREYRECDSWRKKAVQWINQQKIDVLFMGNTIYPQISNQNQIDGIQKIVRQLKHSAKTLYLIAANPALGQDGPACLMKYGINSQQCQKSLDIQNPYIQNINMLRKAIKDWDNVHLINPASFVCPNNICSAQRNGNIVYRDNQHLTASFIYKHAKNFKQQLK